MESLVPYNQIDHPAMPKSRLNSLLIILMVTLLASGGALIFLKQIDAYHRQQIFIAEQAALPVHKNSLNKPPVNSKIELKNFSNKEFSFTLEYPKFYEITEISAVETFPVMNYEKGPSGFIKGYRWASSLNSVFCPVLEVLVYNTNHKTAASWLNSNTDIKRAFANQSTESINNIEFVKFSGPAGDMVPSQVYLALVNKNLYQLNLNFGLKGDGVDPKCGDILSGFELTSEDWKTYRNEEYGFELTFTEPLKEYHSGAVYGSMYSYIPFSILDDRGYIDVFAILIYEKSEWEKRKNSNSLPIHTYITEDKNKVFVYQLSQDPPRGIPDLANEIKKVISTFKFIEKVDTSTWKTYRNEEYGFSFEYPADWKIQNINTDALYSLQIADEKRSTYTDMAGDVFPSISINIWKDTFDSKVDNFIADQQIAQVQRKEKIVIGGVPAYLIEGMTPPASYDFRAVFYKGHVFELSYEGYSNDVNLETDLKNSYIRFITTFKFAN